MARRRQLATISTATTTPDGSANDAGSEPPDLWAQAQAAGERRLEYLDAVLLDELTDEEIGYTEVPVGLYCGCTTCQVREVIDAAWPHLREIARAEPP